jgi:hypothetical protein
VYKQLQLDLFQDDKYIPSQEEIQEAKGYCLKHLFEEHLYSFGIDEIYHNRFDNKQDTFGIIIKFLNNQPNYKKYCKEFNCLCDKYLTINEGIGAKVLEQGYVRYYLDRMSGPAFVLDMLPFEIFKYGRKK